MIIWLLCFQCILPFWSVSAGGYSLSIFHPWSSWNWCMFSHLNWGCSCYACGFILMHAFVHLYMYAKLVFFICCSVFSYLILQWLWWNGFSSSYVHQGEKMWLGEVIHKAKTQWLWWCFNNQSWMGFWQERIKEKIIVVNSNLKKCG